MQVKRFSNGGFVVHKIQMPGLKGKISAWFDKSGKLLDSESLIGIRSMPVHEWHNAELCKIGRLFKEPSSVSVRPS